VRQMRRQPSRNIIVAAVFVLGALTLIGLFAIDGSAKPDAQAACNLGRATAVYDSAGHRPEARIIFRYWQRLYCSGQNPGPATDSVQSIGRHILVQSFDRTANELVWNPATRRFSIVRKPSVARRVFASHGIPPEWNLPITPAWFRQFYHGHDWGPALDPVYRRPGRSPWLRQVFQQGSGTYAGGAMAWKRARSGTRQPWLFMPHAWHPIIRETAHFSRAVEAHNLLSAYAHLNRRLRNKVVSGCIQNLLGVPFWPRSAGQAVHTWSNGGAEVYSTYRAGHQHSTDTFELKRRASWKITTVIRGRKSAVQCPPWSPPSGAFPGTFAVGDSVMVDAQPYLQQMGISVNAAVSRQFDTGVSIIDQMMSQGTLPRTVIVGLGTNGPISQQDFDGLMHTLRHESRVVVLTVREPRWWQDQVNAVIRAGIRRTKNGRIADWFDASANHPEYFAGDGIHLSSAGALAYSHQVANALLGP